MRFETRWNHNKVSQNNKTVKVPFLFFLPWNNGTHPEGRHHNEHAMIQSKYRNIHHVSVALYSREHDLFPCIYELNECNHEIKLNYDIAGFISCKHSKLFTLAWIRGFLSKFMIIVSYLLDKRVTYLNLVGSIMRYDDYYSMDPYKWKEENKA